MQRVTPGQLAAKYSPIAAALLAAALFVTVVPSHPPTSLTAGGAGTSFELPDVSGQTGDAGNGATDVTAADGAGVAASQGGAAGAGGARRSVVPGVQGGAGGIVGQADCTRQKLIAGPTCRPPKWTGTDNGGATARGVTAKEITIVTYVPKRNPQVQALLAAAGTASTAQQMDVLKAYEKFFNDYYELYGRKLKLLFQEGPGDGADPAANQADATTVVNELKAFYVNCPACAQSFHDEVARRGVPSTTVIVPFTNKYHESKAPLMYGVLPDFDLTAKSGSEYYCKRMNGRVAKHAGQAELRTQRKLAIIAIDTPDDAGGAYEKLIKDCGGTVTTVVRYASDISTAQQQATNAMLQVSRSGANVVTCVCDVIAPVFFTAAATQQQYQPEWFQNGLFAMESYKASQLYDQTQWQHAFGISSIGKPDPLPEEEWYIAYKLGGGTDEQAIENAGGALFSGIVQALDAIERAGPKLSVDSFANSMLTMPPYGGGEPGKSHQSFGKNGPGPWTRVDDHHEIWWDLNKTAPNDRPGDQWHVKGGTRYQVGEWPTTEPNVFVRDGSQQ